jgi:hypothetical protein
VCFGFGALDGMNESATPGGWRQGRDSGVFQPPRVANDAARQSRDAREHDSRGHENEGSVRPPPVVVIGFIYAAVVAIRTIRAWMT